MRDRLRRLAARLPLPVKTSLVQGASILRYVAETPFRHGLSLARRLRRRRLRGIADSREAVTLFLVPEAGLTPFYASHAILARTLQESGHAAIILSCNGLKPTCTLKFALRMSPTAPGDHANAGCRRCRMQALKTGRDYRLLDVSLESLIGPDERVLIERIIASNMAAPWNTTHDGVAIGAAALGEVLRDRRKLEVTELDADDLALLNALLFSALAVYLAVGTLASRFAIKRIVYFVDYAYWIPAQAFAERKGIAITRLDHGYNLDVDRRLIGMRPSHGNGHIRAQVDQWPAYQKRSIDPPLIRKIADGALYRLRGHGGASVYSPKWTRADASSLASLGLSSQRRTIVAYSSSADEIICIEKFMQALGKPYGHGRRPFVDQNVWLRALIDWVGAQPDLQLIVRQHPRMAPGRRHASTATQLARMQAEFTTVPSNVVMIWPDSKVSSYSLGGLADVAAVAWSNIGLELARFGIPVVAAFPDIAPYPTDTFVRSAEDAAGYFRALRAALGRPASVEAVTEAFRWTYVAHWSTTIDVSDVVPAPDYEGVPVWRLPADREAIVKVLANGVDLSALNFSRLPTGAGATVAERAAILATIRRFVVFFATGEDSAASGDARISVQDDGSVVVEENGRTIRDSSPVVVRLAGLIAPVERAGFAVEQA